jgi:hypothetical protein
MAREGYEPTYRPPWPTDEELFLASDATPGNRAWCPGASPPDNSCSPKNKGDGKSGDKGGGKSGSKKSGKVHDGTGLAMNDDGTVTVYHHTSAANADKIKATGKLKSAGEPHVYVTTEPGANTGYGDTVVPIKVNPDDLELDDEFPGGRKDFKMSVGRPGGEVKVGIDQGSDEGGSGEAWKPSKEQTLKYKDAKSGDKVGGLVVLEDIPNQSSIDSSLSDYEIVGVKKVPADALWAPENSGKIATYSASERERIEKLAEEIKSSGSIKPLIVVNSKKDGLYVLEGSHRYEALKYLGVSDVPALIVTDTESFDEEAEDKPKARRSFSSRAWCKGASPPDNSCPPSNKGKGGKGSGGGGAKGKSKGDKGGKGSKGRKSSKGFDPDKSSAAIVKKLASVDAKVEKKINAATKKEEKAKAATATAFGKIRSFDTAWVAARDALDKDPGNASKKRALDRINKQMQAAAEAHAKNKDAYHTARQQRELAVQDRAKAGREVLRQEISREILEIAGTDGLATIYESSKATIQKTHADRLKKVRNPEARVRVADAYAFMLEHTNPAIHAGALQPKLSMRGNVRAYAKRGGFDSETFEPTGAPEVVVSSRESPSVIAHEIGHCVEYNPEATRLAQEFRSRRTAGSQEVSFRSKFGRGYKRDERGAPDDFKKAHLAAGYDEKEADHRAHYTGKRYASGSTEVISMGVELLKKDPAAFAKSDPEWFAFTTGIMTGRLLNESRQKKKARA